MPATLRGTSPAAQPKSRISGRATRGARTLNRREAASIDAALSTQIVRWINWPERPSRNAAAGNSTPSRATKVERARGVQRLGFRSRPAHPSSHRTVCTERIASTRPPAEISSAWLEHQIWNLTVASSTLAFPTLPSNGIKAGPSARGSNPLPGEDIAPLASTVGNGARASARKADRPRSKPAAGRCLAASIRRLARAASVGIL